MAPTSGGRAKEETSRDLVGRGRWSRERITGDDGGRGNVTCYCRDLTGIRFVQGWDLFTGHLITGYLRQTCFKGILYHRNQVTLQNREPNTSSLTTRDERLLTRVCVQCCWCVCWGCRASGRGEQRSTMAGDRVRSSCASVAIVSVTMYYVSY